MMPIHAQEKCEIYYAPREKAVTFDDLKHLNFDETFEIFFKDKRNEFLSAYGIIQAVEKPSKDLLDEYQKISGDILQWPANEQDLFWLYFLAQSDGVIAFFRRRDADFAPFIHQALMRQNMAEVAETFKNIMDIFGNRYSEFDPKSGKIIGFPLEKSNVARFFDDKDNGQYLIKAGIQKSISPDALRAFPRPQQLYQTLRDNICENEALKNWYDKRIKAIPDQQRALILVANLFDFEEDLGDWQDWPEPYRYLFLLEMLNGEFLNGGLGQYFFNQSNEDILAMYDALEKSGLVDLKAYIGAADELYEQSRQKISNFDVRRGNDTLSLYSELMKTPPFSNFDEDMDFEGFVNRLKDAMTVIARNHNILPR
ncbi:DUF4375 domain-containing protein [Bartonella sp. HY329]|uniref:DMP19 family protein n=1 Tax=unclassified Bartonella TaxID=2645622 RepID=UPI0021C7CFAD|nr:MULTISPECIES: DUF4375 domain-containing protein [unclassified Bartonella]UXM96160.1 DUF4375 domain-containing protein [Bartonella sp. HY329]UXN10484.1 DUF4375 domain-containing protein [Bartonella sp. HY328]